MKPEETRTIDFAGTAAVLAALVCWTTGPVFIRYLAGYLDSWSQNMLRYGVASLFWLPYLLVQIRRCPTSRQAWRRAIPVAAVNVIMQSFWAASMYYIEPALMALVSKLSVVWIAIFSMILFPAERGLMASKRFWAGAVLSGAGLVGVVMCKESFTSQATMTGIVLTLCSGFFWGIYTVSARIAFKQIDSRIGFAYMALFTTVGLSVLALLFGEPGQCAEMTAKPWAGLIVSAVLSIALSHTLYFVAIKRIGPTISSLVLLASPFTVLAVSHVVFGESMNIHQVIFGIVLLIGAGCSVWAQGHLRNEP